MKRAFALATAAVAALTVAACQKTDKQADPADPGTSSSAVNATQDATSAAVGAASSAVGQVSTDTFVTNAAISDMYEIQAGEIAQKKAQSADIKAFGKMMATDHKAMSDAMKPLVTAAGKTLPTGLDERRKGLIDNLNAASPAEFDKVYLSQQEAAHSEALSLMQGYADNGDDAGLKDAAGKSVPKVQAHLDRVKQLQAAPPVGAAMK